MNDKKVSIIIPIYNCEKFIEKCLISVFEQDYKNIEYIFINDASKDNSIKILKNTLKNYPNIKDCIIINHDINLGAGKSRMDGFLKSSGDYIIWVDSDDWVEKDMVSTLLQTAINENADIVTCDYYKIGSRKSYKKRDHFKDFSSKNKINYIAKLLSGEIPISYLPAQIVKKELYNDIFFPKISFLEDLMITIQLIPKAKKIAYVNKALYYYNRNNPQATTKSKNITLKNIEDIKAFTDNAQEFLKENHIFNQTKDALYFGTISRIYMRLKTFNDKLKFKKILNKISKNTCDIKYIKNHPLLKKREKILLQLIFKYF